MSARGPISFLIRVHLRSSAVRRIGSEVKMDYARLFRLILRHKWVLLAVVIMATAGTWMGARLKGVSYQATSTLMPQPQALQALAGGSAVMDTLINPELQVSGQLQKARIQSLIALMMSPRVLGQVGASLH